jgi:hypothetical protein
VTIAILPPLLSVPLLVIALTPAQTCQFVGAQESVHALTSSK